MFHSVDWTQSNVSTEMTDYYNSRPLYSLAWRRYQPPQLSFRKVPRSMMTILQQKYTQI